MNLNHPFTCSLPLEKCTQKQKKLHCVCSFILFYSYNCCWAIHNDLLLRNSILCKTILYLLLFCFFNQRNLILYKSVDIQCKQVWKFLESYNIMKHLTTNFSTNFFTWSKIECIRHSSKYFVIYYTSQNS